MSKSDERQPATVADALTPEQIKAADALAPEQTQQLADAELQEKYRQAYLEQIRRQSCPGCGDTDIF